MATLDACLSFCESLGTTVGPQIAEWISIVAVAALAWARTRKVHSAAQAGIAAANEQASKAKAEAREARLSLARIEGSLRPSATPELLPVIIPPVAGLPRDDDERTE